MRTWIALVVLTVLGLLVVSGASVRADEAVALETTRVPLPHPVPDETYWYGVYQARGKVGWGMQELKLCGEGEDAVYVSRTKLEATLEGSGQRIRYVFDATDTFRGVPPFDLIRSRETRREGDAVTILALGRVGQGYVAFALKDGEVRRESFEDFDYTLADRLSHIHWAQKGLEKGDRIHIREFDITELTPDIYSYEVKSVLQQPAHGMRIETYEVAMRSSRKGPLGNALMGIRGRVFRGPFAGVAEMRLEPRRQAVERRMASKLFEFGHGPTTEPLGDPRIVKRLTVAIYGRKAGMFQADARQLVHRNEELGEVIVRSGEGVGALEVLEDAERPAYLEATETYPSDHPTLVAMARRATEGSTTARDKVDSLVAFVDGYLGNVHIPDPVPVPGLLQEAMGDASEHARLFVTLARALGLPARAVTGLVYLGDDLQAFGGHVWCEVAVEGRWHAVDPAWGQTMGAVDATHLALARDLPDAVSLLAVTDRLSFEIRDVEYGG